MLIPFLIFEKFASTLDSYPSVTDVNIESLTMFNPRKCEISQNHAHLEWIL